MDPFEYAVGLISIVMGLAMADLGTSLHRLIRAGARVRWDGLAPLSAVFAMLVAIGMWFDVWAIHDNAGLLRYPFFLTILAELGMVFLLAAAALPDETGDRIDLGEFYADNARYFWSIYAAFRLLYLCHWIYFWWPRLGMLPVSEFGWSLAVSAAPLLLALPLIAWPRPRKLHYAAVFASIALNLAEFWGHSL